jgi:hypothetical protein
MEIAAEHGRPAGTDGEIPGDAGCFDDLEVPPHWVEPFARLAQELDLPVADAQAGLAQVPAFVNRVIAE